MAEKTQLQLSGSACSCTLTGEAITIRGSYYRYELHRRRRVSEPVTVELEHILRIGFTQTYSRRMFAVPMCLGFAALLIRAIPSVGYEKEIIRDVWSVGFTLWSLPFQEEAWLLCGALCLLTIPLYWLSRRTDLEINTTRGRYLLPCRGMDRAGIAAFQREFTRRKGERRDAARA